MTGANKESNSGFTAKARRTRREARVDAIINVKFGNGTYTARGGGKTASATSDPKTAVTRCANKLAAGRPVKVKRITNETWMAEITDSADSSKETA